MFWIAVGEDTLVHGLDSVFFQIHAIAHDAVVIIAGRYKEIHVMRAFGERLPNGGSIGIGEGIEEGVFILKHTNNGDTKCFIEGSGET